MITVENLAKQYHARGGAHHVFSDVNFTVRPGQKLAVLGRNGAGKSTLVKIVGGVETPTRGKVRRTMSVSWPLAFGGAFQGSLTGIDNMKFISRIYGMEYARMRSFVEEFAELGRHIALPVKTYSSGMVARLAFGLSLAIDFDCYLIDEVIVVGDQRFHQRCRSELFGKRRDRAFLIASHDIHTIRELCDSALVFHGGKVTVYDDLEEAISIYERL